MATSIFISEDKLKSSSTINGNVDAELLKPYLKVAQDLHIHPVLGTDLYNAIQDGIQNTSLTANETTLLNDYIADALTQWTLYEALPFLSYKIMNADIVRKAGENSQSASKDEITFLRDIVRNTAEFYTKRMVDYLRHNNTLFPEYTTNTNEDMSPTKVSYTSAMNIEGTGKRYGKITLDDFLTPDLKP
tara:strand:+ start:1752 stop:2318 length:567 start_codon:yes stop_codon:yes gene_type:complete